MTALQQIDRESAFRQFKEKSWVKVFGVFSTAPFRLCFTAKAKEKALEKKLKAAFNAGFEAGEAMKSAPDKITAIAASRAGK